MRDQISMDGSERRSVTSDISDAGSTYLLTKWLQDPIPTEPEVYAEVGGAVSKVKQVRFKDLPTDEEKILYL